MALLYASIPIMVLAVAIAVMPLVFSIVHHARRNEFKALAPVTVVREVQTDRAKAA